MYSVGIWKTDLRWHTQFVDHAAMNLLADSSAILGRLSTAQRDSYQGHGDRTQFNSPEAKISGRRQECRDCKGSIPVPCTLPRWQRHVAKPYRVGILAIAAIHLQSEVGVSAPDLEHGR